MNKSDPTIHQGPLGEYQARKSVHPKRIDGAFRRFKWLIMAATLLVYYGLPWIRWDRGPYAPDQAVLVDLARRRFYMFDIEIWPHEFYFLAGMLIMAGIGLFLITSAVGRAWCGYACPQTVWTDLFQHVDRFVDGDRNARMKLDAAPWTWGKVFRRAIKWSIYLTIAFWTGGAWIMYFSDAPTMVVDFWSGQAPMGAYVTVGMLTLSTFALGGFMREQVCVYMCPWPRIQTALMDEHSLQITYKDWRGESRGSVKKAKKDPEKYGDCIDCNLCASVCPTGWDIRKGPDISCITCGLCIDACDRVMKGLDRPRGLIDYITLDDAQAEADGGESRSTFKALFRARTIVYFVVWAGIGAGLLFALGTRQHTEISASRDRNPAYTVMRDGSVRNNFTIKIRNMESRPRDMRVSLDGLEDGVMWTESISADDAARSLEIEVAADQTESIRIYVIAPRGAEGEDFAFNVLALDEQGETDSAETHFETPED